MRLRFQGHEYKYAAEQMLLTLFPGERPVYTGEEERALTLALAQEREWLTATATLDWEGKTFRAQAQAPAGELTGEALADDRVKQRILKLAFYKAGCEALGRQLPWGALTGVRPVKLPTKALLAGKREDQAARELEERYLVSPGRAALAARCARASVETLTELEAADVSLYVGIPFCPTRCAYCSFVSADVSRCLGLVDPFLDCLERELAAVGKNLRDSGRRIRTVYIGGGTPTTLSHRQLERLLGAMEETLDLTHCGEFTVEAGRPDTITREKLEVLAAGRPDRVSVNPQTMEDEVLQAMGRAHRAGDILEAYDQVRRAGKLAVNMDLIAGLPKDTPEGFRRSLEQTLALGPENITVHTLALKKGSALMERQGLLPPAGTVEAMLDFAWRTLEQKGYVPYYLYRQKYMSGGFENVGWCLPGRESRYNIIMMEELHTVLALGGGGMTKLVDRRRGSIRRLANPKYPKEYIERIDAVCKEKEGILWPIS